MKPIHITLFFWVISLPLLAQQNEKIEALDKMIQQGITDWKIPGLATVVVKDNEVIFKKTYGVKSIESNDPVNGETLFAMASTTKATVAMAMGMLVDEGKLDWDDKVIEHLPSFQLSDPYITADARVKDLFTHNLGIANADMLWVLDSLSTTETLRRFSNTKKVYPLRGGFIYQNIMYAAAGEIIKNISGKSWQEFVQERLFNPLNMKRSQTRATDILKAGNYATPHYDFDDQGVQMVDRNYSDQIGAAGMMWSSIDDISYYLKFILAKGVIGNDTLIKPDTFKTLFKPHALIPENQFYPTARLTQPNWLSYGLGWFQHDYRGHKLDFHTGSLQGLVAIAGVMHDKNVAVYVFANMDHAELRHAIMYQALDFFAFDDDNAQWHSKVLNLYDDIKEKSKEGLKKQEEYRVTNTQPTLDLASYTGRYVHPLCGTLSITQESTGLQLNFNDFEKIVATHWHYDTFRTKTNKRWANPLLLTFHINSRTEVETLDFLGYTFTKTN